MTKRLVKELPIWVILLLPPLYLIINWELLPDTIPLHYNLYGEADRWGDKTNLIWLTTLVPFGIYLFLLLAIYIDPKKKISSMAAKFYFIRLFMNVIVATVIFLFTYSLIHKTINFPGSIFVIVGVIFFFLGNYFRSLKPNYFIGFRTPWTLENSEVWRETHQYCSKIWFIGGVLLIVMNIWQPMASVWLINSLIVIFLIIIPIVYSYRRYQTLTNRNKG